MNLIKAINAAKERKECNHSGTLLPERGNTRHRRLRWRQFGIGSMGSQNGSGHYCDVWRSLYGGNGKGALSGQESVGTRHGGRLFVGGQLSGGSSLHSLSKSIPGYTVISYVNTTAAVKAVTDVVVTSTNAKQIVESFPKDEKIIFGPDRNLGNYINSVTNRNMLLWDGACHVHEQFSVEKIVELKAQHPEALVLAHPECKSTVLKLADVVGSTAALLKYAVNHPENTYIVATESGILHEMQKKCPQTTFIPAPPNDSTCGCNECSFMRLNTLEKLYECLKNEAPEITVDPEVAKKAVKPIQRMLEISAKLGL